MEWTREERYQKLDEFPKEKLKELEEQVAKDYYRQSYHLMGKSGLINDPNGLVFFNGEYHVFYQYFPLGPVHGLKHWGHYKSKDMINWEDMGIAITPGNEYDSHGVYSGSAIVIEDEVKLIYTANKRDENWVRSSSQCVATMDKAYNIQKEKTPIIPEIPNGYTEHFRDPKVWKEGETFYLIIGAQNKEKEGEILFYKGKSLEELDLVGEIPLSVDKGFMIECPDYFNLKDKGILIYSPQGLEPEGDLYNNIYQSGYIVGNPMDLETLEYRHNEFVELDRGFDFYAPQTFLKVEDGRERRILIGWMGLPEIEYPTDNNGWAHCLTLPRELTLKGDKLLQNPVEELRELRKDMKIRTGSIDNEVKKIDLFGDSYELEISFKENRSSKFGIKLRTGIDEETNLNYNSEKKIFEFDRAKSGEVFAEEFGTSRRCNLEELEKLRIFVDKSSVEVFINDGEEVFTGRIFPKQDSNGIEVFSNDYLEYKINKYEL